MAERIDFWSILTDPLIRQNPVTLQILGICSALAVTTSLATALTMSVSLTVVLTLSAILISLIRRHIPDTIRLIVQIVIVASLVIVIDQILQAYFAEISRALSIYVSLITTNCLVLGRTEAYARHHAPLPAAVDAFGNGLGYSLVLLDHRRAARAVRAGPAVRLAAVCRWRTRAAGSRRSVSCCWRPRPSSCWAGWSGPSARGARNRPRRRSTCRRPATRPAE